MNIRIGTRKSPLAIRQTEAVMEILKRKFPHDTFEMVGISTRGDMDLKTPLTSLNGKGVFIKEIEKALISDEIDMAIHSAKDMPTEITEGLEISAAPVRGDRRDVLLSFTDNIKVIGTSSARREAQAKKLYPHAEFKPIRGNIHTRVEKVRRGEYDAVIMAKTALDRLGITDVRITDLGDEFICAAGQGIIAVETVKDKMKKYTEAINDDAVMTELTAERSFLAAVGGGCHAPCGASAVFRNGNITMRTFYSDGKKSVYLEMTDINPVRLGKTMAEKSKGN